MRAERLALHLFMALAAFSANADARERLYFSDQDKIKSVNTDGTGLIVHVDFDELEVVFFRGGIDWDPVNGKIYCVDANGICVVIQSGRTYKELARIDLGEATRATPAVANGQMYLRTFSHLMSIGGSD